MPSAPTLARFAIVASIAFAGAAAAVARCEEPPTVTVATVTVAASDDGLSDLVTGLVRAHLPHEFEQRKDWGKTTEVWDGLHMSLDGPRLRTKRKTKEVNHGTWKLYRARLTDPERFTVTVANIRSLDDGRAAFDAEFAAPLEIFARLSEWQRGVQLISLSAEADAHVRLRVTCAVRTRLASSSGLVPDVVIEPEVTAAQIELVHFRLRRISQLRGSVARELGEEAERVIARELRKRNDEIVAKINRQLGKRDDKLRLSLSDLAQTPFGDLRAWAAP